MKSTTTMRASRGFVQAAGRAPLMEGLEVRRLMAADPMIDAEGVLQVVGTNKADAIVLSMDNTGAGPARLKVSLNNVDFFFAPANIPGGIVVRGGNGADDLSVVGLLGKAVAMYGGNGQDRLAGGNGVETLDGGNGLDRLDGGAGNDLLYGGNGRDTLNGGDGADQLYGGNGRDDLDGGFGADRLEGGLGVDRITGGRNADHFVAKASEIVDMTATEGDTGDLIPEATAQRH